MGRLSSAKSWLSRKGWSPYVWSDWHKVRKVGEFNLIVFKPSWIRGQNVTLEVALLGFGLSVTKYAGGAE